MNKYPLKTVDGAAPIRICDIGGCTDTWFAENGAVSNIAVADGGLDRFKLPSKAAGGPAGQNQNRDSLEQFARIRWLGSWHV